MLRILLLALALFSPAFAADEPGADAWIVVPMWDVQRYRAVSNLWEQVDVYWHQGDFENCIRLMKQIIAIDPTQSDAYENAGWLLESTDKTFEGFDMLVRNVIANPRSADAHFELGIKHYFFGNFDLAVQRLERASELGFDPMTERMLGHACERAGDRTRAIQQFALLVGYDPNDGAALNNLLRVLNRIPPSGDPTVLWHRPEAGRSDQ